MTNKRTKKITREEQEEIYKDILAPETTRIVDQIRFDLKCKTPNQKLLLNSIEENQITVCSGRAGSGKTFVTCAAGLKLLKKGLFKKIVLIKSVTTLKNEELGFLKGTLEEKMMPFMDSFLDQFEKLIGETNFNKLRDMGIIKVIPIAFARGRTLDNSYIILDEAQNIDIENMRTLMTRIGENSKMIILGDVKQKDIRNKKESSLEVVLEKFKDKENFGTVELMGEDDVVRNPIIKVIEDIFDQIEEDRHNNLGKKQILKD